MPNGMLKKLILLNGLLAIGSVVLYSPGLIGLSINQSSTLQSALAITIGFMIAATFIAGNYMIFTTKEKQIEIHQIDNMEECIEALKYNLHKDSFKRQIRELLNQQERFQKKRGNVDDILLQKFESTEITYHKYKTVLDQIEAVFYQNAKSVANKVNIFDQVEWNRIKNETNSTNQIIKDRYEIYKEYIDFVNEAVEKNEEFLLKLDKLLLELSKLNSIEMEELDAMPAMKEIDDLIQKSKFYK